MLRPAAYKWRRAWISAAECCFRGHYHFFCKAVIAVGSVPPPAPPNPPSTASRSRRRSSRWGGRQRLRAGLTEAGRGLGGGRGGARARDISCRRMPVIICISSKCSLHLYFLRTLECRKSHAVSLGVSRFRYFYRPFLTPLRPAAMALSKLSGDEPGRHLHPAARVRSACRRAHSFACIGCRAKKERAIYSVRARTVVVS